MPTPYHPIEERLTRYNTGLTNARNVPYLQNRVALYGYDTERLDALIDQCESVLNAHIAQQKEYGEQFGATRTVEEARKTAEAAYMHLVKLGRVIFRNDYDVYVKLTLNEDRKKSFSGWLIQARTFFDNLLSDTSAVAKYAQYNNPLTALQSARALLLAVEQAHNVQVKETGEAQRATRDRDTQMDALDEAMAEFYALSRLACEDDPQLLEMLEIVVK